MKDRLEKHVWWMKSADSCAEESQPCTVNADEHSSRVTKSGMDTNVVSELMHLVM